MLRLSTIALRFLYSQPLLRGRSTGIGTKSNWHILILVKTTYLFVFLNGQCHKIFEKNNFFLTIMNRLKQFRKLIRFCAKVRLQSFEFYFSFTVGNTPFSYFRNVAIGYLNTSTIFRQIVPLKWARNLPNLPSVSALSLSCQRSQRLRGGHYVTLSL